MTLVQLDFTPFEQRFFDNTKKRILDDLLSNESIMYPLNLNNIRVFTWLNCYIHYKIYKHTTDVYMHMISPLTTCSVCLNNINSDYVKHVSTSECSGDYHESCELILLQWVKQFLLTINNVNVNTLYVKYMVFKHTNALIDDVKQCIGYQYIDLYLQST